MAPPNELFIVLSDFCNFSCGHCVTNSGPKKFSFRISETEIEEVISFARGNSDIKRIHFSGGEPTLHLKEIIQIQEKLPELEYALTTNGWFGDRPETVLDKIKLDAIFVSYDSFHKPFASPARIRKLLSESLRRGLPTFLKFTMAKPEDILLLREVSIHGVQVITSRVVETGRYKSLGEKSTLPKNNKILEGTCPSLQNRPDNLDRLVFLPQRGLSPCCGPLSNDKTGNKNFVHSPLSAEYSKSNHLYRQLRSGSFSEQAAQMGVSLSKVDCSSACSACSFLYENFSTLGIPSLYELASRSEISINFNISRRANSTEAERLLAAYKVAYLYKSSAHPFISSPSISDTVDGELADNGVTIEKISDKNVDVVTEFFFVILKENNPEATSDMELAELKPKVVEFLLKAPCALVYVKRGSPVALIGYFPGLDHPVFCSKVNHIGVLGYDRRLITPHVSALVKRSWILKLREGVEVGETEQFPITARIDQFNQRSINFFEELGFKPSFIELVKR